MWNYFSALCLKKRMTWIIKTFTSNKVKFILISADR